MRRWAAAALAVAVVASPACRRTSTSQVRSTDSVQIALPSVVAGLQVSQEDLSKQATALKGRTYFDGVGLYTLRENKLVKASLQVGVFNSLARPQSEQFRSQIIALMGKTTPRNMKVGEVTVFRTTGTQQVIYAWFHGRGFFILSVKQDFPFRRTLLRRLVTVSETL